MAFKFCDSKIFEIGDSLSVCNGVIEEFDS